MRAAKQFRKPGDRLGNPTGLVPRQVIAGVLAIADMEIVAMRDGTDQEAIAILHPEAVLVFFHDPRRRKPPEVEPPPN